MGSCVSRSPSAAALAGSSGAKAKVVDIDGSMAQYAAPVTALDALGRDDRGASVFLCSSDELRFDAPPRALADEEALQPGWLYFVLPVSMLHLALSGHEMAALAFRASAALAVAGGVASPPRPKNVGRVLAGATGKQRKTARVAPLAVADDAAQDETVAKSRRRAGNRSRGSRRRAGTPPKLSPILNVGFLETCMNVQCDELIS